MISAIKRFKEENEIPVEDEQILSSDDSSISDLSNSKLESSDNTQQIIFYVTYYVSNG